MLDGGQEESQTRRGSGRVLDDQQIFIFGLEQIFKGNRDREVVRRKIRFIVVNANISIIHRQGLILKGRAGIRTGIFARSGEA